MAGPSSHWVENMRRIRNFAHSILLKNIRVLRVAAERFSTYSVKLQLFAFCPLTVGFTIVPRKGEEINDLMRQHIYIFCKIFLFHGVLVVLVITFILIILCYESSSLQDSCYRPQHFHRVDDIIQSSTNCDWCPHPLCH